jgi:Spy/CpxP family protein refolding chaperone
MLIAAEPMAPKFCFIAALSLVLVAGIAVVPFSADAQEQESPTVTKKLPSPDEMVDVLGSKLNLSDDQKAQIKPIIEERRQKLQALRSDTSMRPFPKKRKMKSIFDESDKKIKAVLNDEQKKQYAQIEQQMREEIKERVQNRDSAN